MKVKKSTLAWRLTALVMIMSLLLAACASNIPVPTSTAIPPTSTPVPTATPSIAPPAAQGSELDQALLDEIWNNDLMQAQKTQWEVWIQYWQGATTPINIPDTKELRYELLIDPSNPPQAGNDPQLNEKVVLLLTWHDPIDKTKTVRAFFPVNTIDGGFQSEPPTIESPYEIATGTEPLLLGDGELLTLVWRVNDFVYLNDKGEVVAEIDRNGIKQETTLGIVQRLSLPETVMVGDTFSYRNKYRIDGDKMMNDYNNTIAAVKENEAWRALGESQEDKNLKYGALADSLGMEVLLDANAKLNSQPGNLYMMFNAVFTGEYEVVDWYYSRQDKLIKDYRGKAVYKDGDGTVQTVSVSLFSPNNPGKIVCRTLDGWGAKAEGFSLDGALNHYQSGQKWLIFFMWEGHRNFLEDYCDPETGICKEEWNMGIAAQREQADDLKQFVQSWQDSNPNSSIVPEDMFLPSTSVRIR